MNRDVAQAVEAFERAASCAHAILDGELDVSRAPDVVEALLLGADAMRELGDHWRGQHLRDMALKYRDRELEALRLVDSIGRLASR